MAVGSSKIALLCVWLALPCVPEKKDAERDASPGSPAAASAAASPLELGVEGADAATVDASVAVPSVPSVPSAAAAPSATAPSREAIAYCKKLGGKAYMLCDRSDSTCKFSALNKQQACEKTGRWP